MFNNTRIDPLKSAIVAAEDLRKVSAMNIANASTIGYKAYQGVFAPNCECQCFSDLLPEVASKLKAMGYPATPSGQLHLELTRDPKPGKKLFANGKSYEASNVDPTREFSNLITAASMTRSALSAIQLENRLQQEVLNLGR
jgi:flagellar basal body rod protein FlgG